MPAGTRCIYIRFGCLTMAVEIDKSIFFQYNFWHHKFHSEVKSLITTLKDIQHIPMFHDLTTNLIFIFISGVVYAIFVCSKLFITRAGRCVWHTPLNVRKHHCELFALFVPHILFYFGQHSIISGMVFSFRNHIKYISTSVGLYCDDHVQALSIYGTGV